MVVALAYKGVNTPCGVTRKNTDGTIGASVGGWPMVGNGSIGPVVPWVTP